VAEGIRLVKLARAHDVEVYLLGGVAIAARRPAGISAIRDRAFNDIDLVVSRKAGRSIKRFLLDLGYRDDHEFNVVNGRTRMLFRDDLNARDLDVLIGEFAMCHELPILERANLSELTVPLGDLLLTKLQIVELNEKDAWDVYNLLWAHECREDSSGSDEIDIARVAELCSRDWGLWRTVTGNLASLSERLERERDGLMPAARELLAERLSEVGLAISKAKKTRRWTLRSRIGDRVRWYEQPEEAH
jgi:hypothetical protein